MHFLNEASLCFAGFRRVDEPLITLGPQGVVFEVTPDGEEVWRFVNPVEQRKGRAPAVVRQGAQRGAGNFGLFFAERYPPDHCAQLRDLAPGPRVEDFVPHWA